MNSTNGECYGKLLFKSDASAKRFITYRRRHGQKIDSHIPYYCKSCRAWHLTSRREIKNGQNNNER